VTAAWRFGPFHVRLGLARLHEGPSRATLVQEAPLQTMWMRLRLPAVAGAVLIATAAIPAAAQTCACDSTYLWVVAKIERDYAGFADKAGGDREARYDAWTARFTRAAHAASSADDCERIAQRWLAFFADGHLSLRVNGPAFLSLGDTSATAIRRAFISWPARALADTMLPRGAGPAGGHVADSIEGFWSAAEGAYRLAVIPSAAPGEFDAIVLRADSVWWVPGQIKATFTTTAAGVYRARVFLRDHSEVQLDAVVRSGALLFAGLSPWVRTGLSATDSAAAATLLAARNEHTRFRRLSDRTLLLQLPSFADGEAAVIDSLVRMHQAALDRTPNLILDLRGNTGGSDYVYAPLLPLIYTNPIAVVGTSIYATDDNIAKYEAFQSRPGFSEAQYRAGRRLIDSLRTHRGGFLHRPDDTVRMERVLPRPARIAVLIDRGCASSCEQFLLAARQSAKVTLLGERSAGVLDYANVRVSALPCGPYVLRYPTSRSQRLPLAPVDAAGIEPDVPLPANELDAIDWARRWIEREPRR
jgi:Peptidase family S41